MIAEEVVEMLVPGMYSNCMHYCFSQLLPGLELQKSPNWGNTCREFGANLDRVLADKRPDFNSRFDDRWSEPCMSNTSERMACALEAFGLRQDQKGSLYDMTRRLLLGHEVRMNVVPGDTPISSLPPMVGAVGITDDGDTHFFVVYTDGETLEKKGKGISGSGDTDEARPTILVEGEKDVWRQKSRYGEAILRCLCYFWPA